MTRRSRDPLDFRASERVREAAAALIEAVRDETDRRELAPKAYARAIRELERLRGRPLFFPLLLSGSGRGARVHLADGTTMLDFIGGIGVYGFGHSEPDLLETAVVAAAQDTVFQGHLQPGVEELSMSKALLRHAGPHLKHVWLSISGAIANENALKMILHRHTPADRIIVFENAFAGRTTTLAELTDRPAYRQGLPLRGNVLHVPFYDPSDPDSTQKSVAALDAHLKRHPGLVAGMLFELIQGEGGFNTAPREFFVALMERCREAKVAVWVDEVQTFARTGELFAFQTFDLAEWVDLVTVGKTLQGSAVLFRKAYNPKGPLVSGTYAGATVGMAVGTRIIEKLEDEGYLGSEGRVSVLARRVDRRFESIEKRMPRAIAARSGIGAMQAFTPFDGSPEIAGAVVQAAFEEGLMVFGTGSRPMKVRMLLPVNTTDEDLEVGFGILEKALARVAEEKGLAC